jgi:hypothetical protein
MNLGCGDLAWKIGHFERSYEGVNTYYPCISEETKELVLKTIIEDFKQNLRKITGYGGLAPNYRKAAKKSISLLEQALTGEITFESELGKHDLNKEEFPRELSLIFGSFDVLPAAKKIDETIKKLYLKKD